MKLLFKIYHSISDTIIIILQLFGAVILWPIIMLFTDFRVNSQERLKNVKGPIIVTANHESHLDPILVGLALLSQIRLFPIRFMAKKEFFSIPLFNILIWIFGSFKARRGEKLEHSLATSKKILDLGGTIMMFPEGKIVPERGQLGVGKRGAAALSILTGAKILPLAVHVPTRLNLWRFLFTFRQAKKIRVTVGEAYNLNSADYPDLSDEVLSRGASKVMSKIKEIYQLHNYDSEDLSSTEKEKVTSSVTR